jgi:hypothetical protein
LEQSTSLRITVEKPQRLVINVRGPWWMAEQGEVSAGFQPVANTHVVAGTSLAIDTTWSKGVHHLSLTLPMRLHLAPMPDDPKLAAIMYGPVVLAGRLGTENLTHADQFKRDQLMYDQGAIDVPPMILDDAQSLDAAIKPVAGQPLTFTATTAAGPVTLAPIYAVNDERYTVYWRLASSSSDAAKQWQAEQAQKAAYMVRLVDEVKIAERVSERAHHQHGERTTTGAYQGKGWRDAQGGWFSYDLAAKGDGPLVLACTYWGDDAGRAFDISVDGQKLATQTLEHVKPGEFINAEYPLPPALIAGKPKVTVRFDAHPNSTAGGVFGCAILKADN